VHGEHDHTGVDTALADLTDDVEAGPIGSDPATSEKSGVANRIQFGASIRGPVESVDAAGSTMTVLGQTVKIDSDTVFAVKDSLITDFAEQTTQDETAKRLGVPTPYAAVHYDFVLKKA